MSPVPGRVTADLDQEELISLISMYGTALDALAATDDPAVRGLTEELLGLRVDAIATLAARAASGERDFARLN